MLLSCVKEPIHVQSITVSPESAELSEGDHLRLSATVLPADAADKSFVWSSTDNSVAMVDANGEVAALKAGSVVIKAVANDGGVTGSCNITVKIKEVPAESINLSETSVSMNVGDEKQLSAEVRPDNATNKDVVWSSSDDSVVKVSSSGLLTAVAAGEAKVLATSVSQPAVKAECKVSVAEKLIPVTSVTLDKSKMELTKGLDYTLYATVSPSNATNKELSWTSSDENIVVVNQQGTVVAFSTGVATVTATSVSNPEVSASCEFTVVSDEVSVTGVTLVYSTTTVYIPDQLKLEARISPSNATDQNVTWTSSNTSVATVDQGGTVTPVAPGKVSIMVTTRDGGKTDMVTLEVCDTRITGFTFAEYSAEPIMVEGGSSFKLTPVITPDYASNKTVKWESNNSSIATVSSDGRVSFAQNNGQVTISARTEVSSMYCEQVFDVRVMPKEIHLPDGMVVAVGGSLLVNATITPENTYDKKLEYSIGDSSIASVDAEGVVTGLKVGKTTITVKCVANPSVTDTKSLEVIGSNQLSINGEPAISYAVGKLGDVLNEYKSSGNDVTSLKWTASSLMDADDVMSLKTLSGTLLSADLKPLSFVDDGGIYKGYTADELRILPYRLPESIFSGFKKLTEVVMPDSVTDLGSCVCSNCVNLKKVTLPAGLKTMQRYCFNSCTSLESIDIPEGFERFEKGETFEGCSALKSFRIPDSCTKAASFALRSCTALESLHVGRSMPMDVEIMYGNAFNLKTITLSEGNPYMKMEGKYLVSKDGKTLVMMPSFTEDNICTVPGYENVKLRLYQITPYTKLIYSEGTSVIGGYIYRCDKMEEFVIPSTATKLTYDNFILGNGVSFKCYAVNPPEINAIIGDGLSKVKEVLVPASSVDAYKAAPNWSQCAEKIKAM